MRNVSQFFLRTIISLLLASCSDSYESQSEMELDEYQVIRELHFSSLNFDTLEGSGWLTFKKPLDGIYGSHLYNLSFFLGENSESQLEVVFNHSNLNLNDGISLSLERDEENHLRVLLGLTNRIPYDISSFFPNKIPSEPLNYRIAIFHDPLGPRVMIWNLRHAVITEQNVLFDSRSQGLVLSEFRGGSNWGLKLNKVQVLRAQATNYYVK